MKKVFLIAFAMTLGACSNEGKIKKILEEEIKKVAKDPDSYQFIEMKIDTVTKGEAAKLQFDNKLHSEKSEVIKEKYRNFRNAVDDSIRHKKEYPDNSFASLDHLSIEIFRSDIKNMQEKIKQNTLDSSKYSPFINDQSIVGFVILHHCRLKNGFGGYGIEVSHASFDKDLNFIRLVAENENDRYSWLDLYRDFRKNIK